MLHLGGDNVSPGCSVGEKHALECMVVGFAPATGEHDLVWLAPQKVGDLPARGLNRLLRRPPGPVLTGRITEGFGQHLLHRCYYFRCHRCTGVEIKVNAFSLHA
jgi:hypothetical protein